MTPWRAHGAEGAGRKTERHLAAKTQSKELLVRCFEADGYTNAGETETWP